MENKDYEALEDNTELWENGQLGCDEEFVRVSPPEVKERVMKALGIQTVKFNINSETSAIVERFAKERNLNQTVALKTLLNIGCHSYEMTRNLNYNFGVKK